MFKKDVDINNPENPDIEKHMIKSREMKAIVKSNGY
jgi:hypothetical protein